MSHGPRPTTVPGAATKNAALPRAADDGRIADLLPASTDCSARSPRAQTGPLRSGVDGGLLPRRRHPDRPRAVAPSGAGGPAQADDDHDGDDRVQGEEPTLRGGGGA